MTPTSKPKTTRSKMLLYTMLLLIAYLLSRAYVLNEIGSSYLAVGLILGFGFGTYYEYFKVLEAKAKLETQVS